MFGILINSEDEKRRLYAFEQLKKTKDQKKINEYIYDIFVIRDENRRFKRAKDLLIKLMVHYSKYNHDYYIMIYPIKKYDPKSAFEIIWNQYKTMISGFKKSYRNVTRFDLNEIFKWMNLLNEILNDFIKNGDYKSVLSLLKIIGQYDYYINEIGLIKNLINDTDFENKIKNMYYVPLYHVYFIGGGITKFKFDISKRIFDKSKVDDFLNKIKDKPEYIEILGYMKYDDNINILIDNLNKYDKIALEGLRRLGYFDEALSDKIKYNKNKLLVIQYFLESPNINDIKNAIKILLDNINDKKLTLDFLKWFKVFKIRNERESFMNYFKKLLLKGHFEYRDEIAKIFEIIIDQKFILGFLKEIEDIKFLLEPEIIDRIVKRSKIVTKKKTIFN